MYEYIEKFLAISTSRSMYARVAFDDRETWYVVGVKDTRFGRTLCQMTGGSMETALSRLDDALGQPAYSQYVEDQIHE